MDDQGITARRLLVGWLAAKTLPRLVVVAVWLTRLLALGAYGAYVWWRTRRAVLGGALDDAVGIEAGGPPPSVVVRERGVLGWIKGPVPRGSVPIPPP